MNSRFPLLAAGLFGLTGVGFGAVGAHALRPYLESQAMMGAWETGVQYQLIHSVALLGIAGWARTGSGRALTWAVRAWIAGIVFFSGSLYLLALGAPRWVGPLTPLGGVSLLAGWACVVAAGMPSKKHES